MTPLKSYAAFCCYFFRRECVRVFTPKYINMRCIAVPKAEVKAQTPNYEIYTPLNRITLSRLSANVFYDVYGNFLL